MQRSINGNISIHMSKESLMDRIVLFLIIFGIYTLNRGSASESGLFIPIVGITFLVSLLHILKNKKIYFGTYFIIQFLFLFICYISRYWAFSDYLARIGFNTLVLTSLIIFSVVNIVDSEKNCLLLIKMLAWNGIIMFIYMGLENGFGNIINIRTSSQNNIITDINANSLGVKYIISALSFSIYKLYSNKKKIYNFFTYAMVILAIFTGSRKVIIMIIFFFMGLYIMKSKKNRFFKFLIGATIVILFLISIFSIPSLNEVIGTRLLETLSIFDSNSINPYSSTGIRFNMMKNGLELFKERPMIGYGIANAELFNNGTYLHNNYLELLVNIGVIGTLIYYSNILLSLTRNIKLYKYNTDKISIFFILVIICMLILDIGQVTYNNRIYQIIIAIASRYYVIIKKCKNKKENINYKKY